MPNPRQVYMVLSPRSLSYSQSALESLFRNSMEPIQPKPIADSKQDKEKLFDAAAARSTGPHQCTVSSEEDLAEHDEPSIAVYSDRCVFRCAVVGMVLLMCIAGAHLDPRISIIWRHSLTKRIRTKLDAIELATLRSKAWGELKCFDTSLHAQLLLNVARKLVLSDGHAALCVRAKCYRLCN